MGSSSCLLRLWVSYTTVCLRTSKKLKTNNLYSYPYKEEYIVFGGLKQLVVQVWAPRLPTSRAVTPPARDSFSKYLNINIFRLGGCTRGATPPPPPPQKKIGNAQMCPQQAEVELFVAKGSCRGSNPCCASALIRGSEIEQDLLAFAPAHADAGPGTKKPKMSEEN